MLSVTTMYTAVYLLPFAAAVKFSFLFLFYFKKDFLHNIPLLFCLLTINILPSFNLSQTLPGLSQTWLFFQHEIFPSATFPLSTLNLPMYHNKNNILILLLF